MTRVFAWLLLVTLGVIWGVNFLFMKQAVAVIPPLEVAWWRTLFGALPIAVFALMTRALDWRDWRYLPHFAAMALLANVAPYVCFVVGTRNLPSGVAGVISGSIPFITAGIVAVALPSEKLTRSKLLGLGMGFVGVVLVIPLRDGELITATSPILGVIAMLGGSVSYAFALVYARRFVAPLEMSPVRLATYQMTVAFGMLSPFVAPGHWSALAAAPAALLGLVVGLGLMGTGIAFVIYYALIQKVGALKAASVYYLPPVVALAVGALFAGEQVDVRQIGGASLILGGIFYANRQDR